MKIVLLVLSFCLILLLMSVSGCAGIDTGRAFIPVKLQVISDMKLPFKADKCLYDQNSGTYYILEQGRPYIYFYQNNIQINKIGGLGVDKINFKKLSDIAIDPDGNLLALDEFAKVIRKYSRNGKWIADIDLSAYNQPSRICSTPDSDIIIYDSATRELRRISAFDGKVMFAFGKFQVESISGITASRDYVAVVNERKDKTLLFSGIGMLIKELDSQVALDIYQNQYIYKNGAMMLAGSDLKVPCGKPDAEVKLSTSGKNVILTHSENVLTIIPIYQEN